MAGFRISDIHAFVAVDPSDGDEGIIGEMMPNGQWMPFIGADETRIRSLRPMAEKIARGLGYEVRLVRFSQRTDVEVIHEARPSDPDQAQD